MTIKLSYREMLECETFQERYEYLNLHGSVGEDTFGSERLLNQRFYRSNEWKRIRNRIIVRDQSFDLAHPDRYLTGSITIHHINPITPEDILNSSYKLVDPNNLVCVSHETHNAIHYGDYDLISKDIPERVPGDTMLW